MAVHNPKRKLERAITQLDQQEITPNNIKAIKQFIEFIAAQGVKELRQVKYIYTLQNLASWLNKDFNKATKQDIIELCSNLEKDSYSDWTKHDYKVILKKFYIWLRNKHNDDIDEWETPKEVKWIKVKAPKDSKKVPSDLLTPQDIQLLADHCRNLREKALILTLYESGARIGELLDLKVKDAVFDEYGAFLNLTGKTGYRKIRIVGAAPAISQWLQHEHPKHDDKNSYLFCNINQGYEGKMISYDVVKKILRRVSKRADFKKKLHPHLFRHSRASELAEHMNDAPLCSFMGWEKGSQMSRIYTHIEDTNRIILELNGLVKKETDKSGQFREVICPRCSTKNPFGMKVCGNCSMGLDIKSIEEFEQSKRRSYDVMEILKENPDVHQQAVKLLELLQQTIKS